VRTVVTGGAGFIGSNLCRMLASKEQVTEIVVLDDLSTGFEHNLADIPKVELVVGSILDTNLVRQLMGGAAAVAHLAARPSVPLSLVDPLASHHVNVTGTLEVLEAARDVGAYVVVASSSAVYGDSEVSPKHEGLPQLPLSPYGVTKVATEGYASSYAHSFGLETLALRFFNVFGPGQPAGHAYAAVVPAFVSAALEGRPIPVFGDGRQVRDFVFVGNVAAVLATAMTQRTTSSTPVNLASGRTIDLLGLIAELEVVLGHPLEIEYLDPRPGDILDSQADQSLCAALFPGIPTVDLRAGLRLTVDWFERQRGNPLMGS